MKIETLTEVCEAMSKCTIRRAVEEKFNSFATDELQEIKAILESIIEFKGVVNIPSRKIAGSVDLMKIATGLNQPDTSIHAILSQNRLVIGSGSGGTPEVHLYVDGTYVVTYR